MEAYYGDYYTSSDSDPDEGDPMRASDDKIIVGTTSAPAKVSETEETGVTRENSEADQLLKKSILLCIATVCVFLIILASTMAPSIRNWLGAFAIVLTLISFPIIAGMGILDDEDDAPEEGGDVNTTETGRIGDIDPIQLMIQTLPDADDETSVAIARIERLRSFANVADRTIVGPVGDACTLLREDLPQLLCSYEEACRIADADERAELKSTLTASVIRIGQAAEEARLWTLGERKAGFGTTVRYIDSKTPYCAPQAIGPIAAARSTAGNARA